MRRACFLSLGLLVGALPTTAVSGQTKPSSPADWPPVTSQSRPWTRWWWLGSAVDQPEITRQLESFRRAGLGGVEISPIYGARGAESRSLSYLSPEWTGMLRHTVREGKRLGLGVDMIQGTGWPFGGPWVPRGDVAEQIVLTEMTLGPDGQPSKPLPTDGSLDAVVVRNPAGKTLDLTSQVYLRGKLVWKSEADGPWKLYVAQRRPTGQKVKRSGPGGEGPVVDPFGRAATRRYLDHFQPILSAIPSGERPRALFNDSFEAFGANWTPDLIPEFFRRRGYNLRLYLPALMGKDTPETVARVRSDYRQTVHDLLLEDFTRQWSTRAHQLGMKTRNQAHGSPANVLDLYAAADIPETEIFGPGRRPGTPPDANWREIMVCKLASSAAHVAGKPHTSSESMTWLGEHFQVPLSAMKEQADVLLLSGVNHLFYHGAPYSPADTEWPGWLFYAATDVTPANSWWRHFPALNDYLARSQSFLQSGRPDNDVLLYFPIHDLWVKDEGAGNLLQYLRVHNPESWLDTNLPEFGAAAKLLWERGYGFDFVSDDLLRTSVSARDGRLVAKGGEYRTLVVAGCTRMPPETMERIASLARGGAKVVFLGARPSDVPGMTAVKERQRRLLAALERMAGPTVSNGTDLPTLLAKAGIQRERMTDRGLAFIRRREAGATTYFVVNRSERRVDGWIPFSTPADGAMLFDPMRRVSGKALFKPEAKTTSVRLQLDPGQSVMVRLTAKPVAAPDWSYLQEAGAPVAVSGNWRVEFIEGGPQKPAAATVARLESWTEWPDDREALRAFSGTARYTISVPKPERAAERWVLDLGAVHHSARVRLNGRDLGTLIAPPYRLSIPTGLLRARNELEVEVANLMANRMADLDRRKVPWQKFYFVNIDYKAFDASGWAPMPSGLLGPVQLVPHRTVR